MMIVTKSSIIEVKLGKLLNKTREITPHSLNGYSEDYILGYMDCKNWLRHEISKILEPHQPTDSNES